MSKADCLCRFSPKYPKKILQLSSPEAALRDTQKEFCALDLNIDSFVPSTDDGVNILRIDIKDLNNEAALKYVASTYDRNNNVLRDGIIHPGKRVMTFVQYTSAQNIPSG